MLSNVLIGIDASFKRTGIAVYNNGKITVSEVRGKEILNIDSFSKSFEGVYLESCKITTCIIEEIKSIVKVIHRSGITIIAECPPPQGQYSPGLYALDTNLFRQYNEIASTVYRVYPNYLMHLHGKRNYKKSDSVDIAQKILSNYDVELLTKRLSHDEAESVIFLSRLLYKYGKLDQSIVELIPNITHEKEAVFLYE